MPKQKMNGKVKQESKSLSDDSDFNLEFESPDITRIINNLSSQEEKAPPTPSTSPKKSRPKGTNVPENMISMSGKELRVCSGNEANTELWLVKVPQGFDVSLLDGKLDRSAFTTSGARTVKVKAEQERKRLSVHSYKDSAECKKLSTLVADNTGQLSLGQELQHMMVITEKIKPHCPAGSGKSLTPKRVPLPPGLKIRFTTFGTDEPVPPKKKKRKRDRSTSKDSTSPKAKKKKHKHSRTSET